MNPNEWQTLTTQFTTLTSVWSRELNSNNKHTEKGRKVKGDWVVGSLKEARRAQHLKIENR